MFEFIKAVFLYTGMLGLIIVFLSIGLVLSGWGIKWLSASIVWVILKVQKITGW